MLNKNKKGKIIVHIGLPKTATTTLQIDFFPNLEKSKINYVGVFQPRQTKQKEIYVSFYNSINILFDSTTKKKINNLISQGETLLFSEEMITVSDSNLSWQQKLINLQKLLEDTDYLLIVTVREPVDAMFSYYSELYNRFKKKEFMLIALNDNSMGIYHYDKFFPYLFQLFNKRNIIVVKFEDIIVENYSKMLKELGISYEKINIKLKNNNSRIKTNKYVIVEKNNNVLDLVAYSLKKKGVFKFVYFWILTLRLKKIISKLGKVNFKIRYKVNKPTDQEKEVLKKGLSKSYQYLKKEFKIIY